MFYKQSQHRLHCARCINQVTSNHGWNTIEHKQYLTDIIAVFKNAHIRTSIFVDPEIEMIEAAAETGADRVELIYRSLCT